MNKLLRYSVKNAPINGVSEIHPGDVACYVELWPPFVDGADVVVLITPQGPFSAHVDEVCHAGFKIKIPNPHTETVRVAWQCFAVVQRPGRPENVDEHGNVTGE